jgi:N-glycosylase/DNA lyase
MSVESAGALRGKLEMVCLGPHRLNLDLTLQSGQAFHWQRHGEGWLGAIDQRAAYVESRDGELWSDAAAASAVANYLALDHPLEEIEQSFPHDASMQEALIFCRGMRILRQSSWEALATFITSSMKQVAHIAQISHTLRSRFGTPCKIGDRLVYAYPSASRLASLSETDLRACALGYRAKNLLGSARLIAEGQVDLNVVAAMPDEEARRALERLPGVGEKVANCALLFGFERLRSFPVDVWIERVLREKYFPKRKNVTASVLRTFCATAFGPYGGYAQQYLFHHARLTWKKGDGLSTRKRGRGRVSS